MLGLATLAPDDEVVGFDAKPDGRHVDITCPHTFSEEQSRGSTSASALDAIRNERIRDQHNATTPS